MLHHLHFVTVVLVLVLVFLTLFADLLQDNVLADHHS